MSELSSYVAQHLLGGTGRLPTRDQPSPFDDDRRDGANAAGRPFALNIASRFGVALRRQDLACLIPVESSRNGSIHQNNMVRHVRAICEVRLEQRVLQLPLTPDGPCPVLPIGRHPLQIYLLGTPNDQKVTILLEACWRSC